jgi:AraC family transcriptional regulator
VIGHGDLKGVAETWLAPVSRFHCPDGFGEEVWTDSLSDTLVSIGLRGMARKVSGPGAGSSRPGRTTALQPRGAPSRYVSSGRATFALIYLPDRLVERAAAALAIGPRSWDWREDIVFPDDDVLQNRARQYVERTFDTVDPASTLEMEARALLLVDHLLGLHVPGPPAPARATGGLAPRHVRQVRAYLDTHLDQDVGLATLAALTDLSPKHFARAFKQSMGLPPHQWILRRRVGRAMDLLAGAGPSLIDVALSCGFADQSHFTATFKKITGMTPGRYRAEQSN